MAVAGSGVCTACGVANALRAKARCFSVLDEPVFLETDVDVELEERASFLRPARSTFQASVYFQPHLTRMKQKREKTWVSVFLFGRESCLFLSVIRFESPLAPPIERDHIGTISRAKLFKGFGFYKAIKTLVPHIGPCIVSHTALVLWARNLLLYSVRRLVEGVDGRSDFLSF